MVLLREYEPKFLTSIVFLRSPPLLVLSPKTGYIVSNNNIENLR